MIASRAIWMSDVEGVMASRFQARRSPALGFHRKGRRNETIGLQLHLLSLGRANGSNESSHYAVMKPSMLSRVPSSSRRHGRAAPPAGTVSGRAHLTCAEHLLLF